MLCPVCGFDVKNSKICLNCNENALALNRAINVSIRLYNRALISAKDKDISQAIKFLQRSIYFNKNNYEARNLLGLLYYEIGRLADAVKEWILSSNINKDEKNKAFFYLDIFDKNIRKFEKLDDSVRFYNDAIIYLREKNDDLAVIRLKRAIDINNNFLDALNLLTFCYIVQKKYKKAIKYANKVLEIDKNNEIAKNYIDSLKNEQIDKDLKEYESNGFIKTIDDEEKFKLPIGIVGIGSFIFGVVFCILIGYFLVIPHYVNKKDDEIVKLNENIVKIKEENEVFKYESENLIKTLKTENENLNAKLKTYEDEKILQNYNNIKNALNLYSNGQRTKARDLFKSIVTNGFSESQLKEYNDAKTKIR